MKGSDQLYTLANLSLVEEPRYSLNRMLGRPSDSLSV